MPAKSRGNGQMLCVTYMAAMKEGFSHHNPVVSPWFGRAVGSSFCISSIKTQLAANLLYFLPLRQIMK